MFYIKIMIYRNNKASRSMLVSIITFCLLLPVQTAGSEPIETKRVGKAPLANQSTDLSAFPKSAPDRQMQGCLPKCLRKHQSAAMAKEMILKECQKTCGFEKAVALSESDNFEDRTRAIEMMQDLKDRRAVPVLMSMLEKDLRERTGIWAQIIPVLGSFGDVRAVPMLINLLNRLDEDWLGREMAARALGDINDPSAVPALIGAAWRADTREDALTALSKIKDQRAVPVFLSALQPEESAEAKKAAITGLAEMGDASVPGLSEELNNFSRENPQTERRLLLCDLLGRIGGEAVLNTLKNNQDDPDLSVRECIRHHLSRIQNK